MNETYKERYEQIEKSISEITYWAAGGANMVDRTGFMKFVTNSMNIISLTFGDNSVHYRNMEKINSEFKGYVGSMEFAKGVFLAAKEDYFGGFYVSEYTKISGEIFGSFVVLAKEALANDFKDVAAVLSCAALEDALKKYSIINGINVNDKDMTEVVNLLKSKGLVSGAQKSLLDVMPKIRNYAMHANWEKITSEDVNSVIGFVEQFLVSKF